MKSPRKFLGLILLLAFLAGCSSSPSSQSAPTEPTYGYTKYGQGTIPITKVSDDAKQRHLALADAWLKNADDTASSLGSMELTMVVNFAREHGRIGAPTHDGFANLREPTGERKFDFMPLLTEDAQNGNSFADVIGANGRIAEFNGNLMSVLVADNQQFTPTWAGLVLLHELRHAEQSARPGWDGKSVQASAEREIEVYQEQSKLLSTKYPAFGQNVDQLYNEMVGKLKAGQAIVPAMPRVASIDTMDAIFGPPKSETERSARHMLVYIAAGLRATGENGGHDAQVAFINGLEGRQVN